MKVIILGSGIIGVTTAYMLSKIGCEVIVLEKDQASGMKCSHANGGQLSFSHVEPWSSQNSILAISKAILKPNSFVFFRDYFNKDFFQWMLRFVNNSTEKRTQEISFKLLELGYFSRRILSDILQEEKIDFNYSNQGILHFYRNKKAFHKAIQQANFQKKLGCNLQILNIRGCLELEPNLAKLANQNKLAGGILFKDDASGDPFLFINQLEEICKKKFKTQFIYDCEVKNILTNHKTITGINTSKGVFQADLYVNTLGSYGNTLLKGVEVESDIYPIKGYSLSIPVNENYSAPRISLTDAENKIVYSRLGSTFRVAGIIELCNLKNTRNARSINFLKKTTEGTYNNFGDIENAREWFGFRPYRSNCLPMIGRVKKYGNLFINSGHGSLGWSNSFGSAKIISDLVFGKNLNGRFSIFEDQINET